MRNDDHDDELLKADQRLVEFLAAHGFAGPVYRAFTEELARYGIAVLSAWLRSGLIFARCAEKGIRLPRPPSPWTQEDQLELTLETVARAINAFRARLVQGRWDVEGGASLRTYFIGNCIYQFTGPYKAWLRSSAVDCGLFWDADERWPDPGPVPEEVTADRDEIRRALNDIESDTVRAAVVLSADGYSHAEIAELIGGGATARSIEGALYRHRQRARERGGDR